MAKNFERAIFRDQSIVSLAKDNFLAIRIDRTGEVAKSFGVKGAELVIQDSEGDEVARFVECTETKLVLGIMQEALQRQREIQATSKEWAPKLAKADELLSAGKDREGSEVLAKALREKSLNRFLREKLARLVSSVEERARVRLDAAKQQDESGDAGAAWKSYRGVRDDFWGLGPSSAAKAAMAALEKDPEKKQKLREAKADDALALAKQLADEGKKPQAITALRRIALDFPGTKAADEAKTLARELRGD